MKEYPVGSVCIVIKARVSHDMLGKEVIITGPLELQQDYENNVEWLGYPTDALTTDGYEYCPRHEFLKLKEPPKPSAEDEAFRKFLNNVMKPVEIRDEEVVK